MNNNDRINLIHRISEIEGCMGRQARGGGGTLA